MQYGWVSVFKNNNLYVMDLPRKNYLQFSNFCDDRIVNKNALLHFLLPFTRLLLYFVYIRKISDDIVLPTSALGRLKRLSGREV